MADQRTQIRPPEAPSEVSREALIFSTLFAVITLTLLLVTWSGVYLLSGVRAYVGGERLYTEGRKEAVEALRLYAGSGDEAEWERYRGAVAVPLADGRARRLLTKAPPDIAGAKEALIEGRNHPEDIGVMIRLFQRSGWLPPARQALVFWQDGDELIDQLTRSADALRGEIRKPATDPVAVAGLLAEIGRIDTEMNDGSFSEVLWGGARGVESILVATASLSGLMLLLIGVVASNRLVARLRAREVRFRSIIENASDIVTILDDHGTTLFMSPAVDRVLGWKPEELVGAPIFDHVHVADHKTMAKALLVAQQDRSAIREMEFRFRHRDGSWHTLATVGSSYLDETGQHRIIANTRDITLQRELEGRLAQAGRLESVGRLAGGVAHDFNNLLTVILGAGESAREQTPQGSPARRDLDEIVAATGRASDLTRQLLAFARRQVVEPVVFDLGATLGALESMLRRLLDETIELAIEAPAAGALVRADRAQIEQVILNLAVNARDAMPGGGRLVIRVDSVRPDAEGVARETEGEAGPFVLLEVSDTGHAMEPEVLERIFEPFFSTKESARGTGLGLATTYGIVKQSRGHITVRSEPGRGTRFRVFLPLAPSADLAREEKGSAAECGRGHETLLLVEDQIEVRRVTAKTLRSRGFEVLEAADGEEALARVEGRLATLDLLVTDVVMPRMGGPALADRLREERPDLPVVFITGYTDDERVLAKADRTVLVAKPFSADGLVGAVRGLLDPEPKADPGRSR